MKSNVFAEAYYAAAIRMFNLFDENIPVTLASNTGLRIGTDGQFLIKAIENMVLERGHFSP